MSKSAPSSRKHCTIWLDTDGSRKMFFCFNCRIPLIEYEGNIARIVPGGSPVTPSTILKCKGSVQRSDGKWEDCGQYYSFIGSVYTKNPQMT